MKSSCYTMPRQTGHTARTQIKRGFASVAESFLDDPSVGPIAENLMACCMIKNMYSSVTTGFSLELYPGFDILSLKSRRPRSKFKNVQLGKVPWDRRRLHASYGRYRCFGPFMNSRPMSGSHLGEARRRRGTKRWILNRSIGFLGSEELGFI